MRKVKGAIRLSASDLMRFQACAHATALDLDYLAGAELVPVADADDARLIQEKGDAYEAEVVVRLLAEGADVAEIDKDTLSFEAAVAETCAVLARGPDVVYQAALDAGPWGGYADFLERVGRPSRLGGFSYEVTDTKLKRSPDPRHVLQLVLYSDLLAAVQGLAPENAHLVLGDGRRVSLRLADYTAYARNARRRLESFVARRWQTRPEPVAACALCRWRQHCRDTWERENSLGLVAGITKGQRRKLEQVGISTMAGLATSRGRVAKLAADTLARLRIQARLQCERRAGSGPRFELKSVEPGRGLLRLPRPAEGDLFFDMEGDPHIPGGLEYLYGVHYVENGEDRHREFWAHDRDEEKQATREVLTFFDAHLRLHPDAHIYHYNHYETTALKRLAMIHGVGEERLDHLLRTQRFVDLYRVVQQALIASEPGYSIKDLEAFYMDKRGDEVATAGDSVVAYERWRETRAPEILEDILDYNRTDCLSTRLLRDWLVAEARPEGLAWFKENPELDAGEPTRDPDEADAERERLAAALAPARARMGDAVGDLLFDLAFFHERESDELIDDLDSLGGLEAVGDPVPVKRSLARRYRFPVQETKIRAGTQVRTREGLKTVTVDALSIEELGATLRFGPSAGEPPDRVDLIPPGPIDASTQEAAIRRVITSMVSGDGRYRAIEDLLCRRAPRVTGVSDGTSLIDQEAEVVAETVGAVAALDDSVLPIQGPPGTGKTYVSSMAILHLLKAGKRVAVSSNSHKAIDNLLLAVVERAREDGYALEAAKKVSRGEPGPDADEILAVSSNDDPALRLRPLVGGTAWLLARPELDQAFDYLFVDEAGQVALANLMAMGVCARNLVLVGDPMQLPQPVQGTHPGVSGFSALEYALEGHQTVPPERGIFLPVSRRMHPDVCGYISEIVYEGRLHSDKGAARQQLVVSDPALGIPATGIQLVEVEHSANGQSSPEEVEEVRRWFDRLQSVGFRDRHGKLRPLDLEDILVVAPYNAR